MSLSDITNANPDFKNTVLETGCFPDGTYRFEIEAYYNGQAGGTASSTIMVQSPLAVTLIYPGSPAGSTLQNYYEQFPSFIWSTNLSNAHFKLFELDTANMSAEEIEQLPTYYEQNVSGGILAYPAAAPPLRVGNTYAWQIIATTNSPAGPGILKSPVYAFKVVNSGNSEVYVQILNQLLANLHVEGMEAVMDLLNAGYVPSGNAMFMGQSIPIEQVFDIIQRIARGELVPTRIIVE
jgi:hypothetical protein